MEKKRFGIYDFLKVETKTFGHVEGFVSSKGVEVGSTPSGTKFATFYLNIANRAAALAKAAEVEKEVFLTRAAKNGIDEFVTLKVTAYGWSADNCEKAVKAGQRVLVLGELKTANTDKGTFVSLQMSGSPTILWRPKTEGVNPNEVEQPTVQPKPEPQPQPQQQQQNSLVEESELDIDDDELPF